MKKLKKSMKSIRVLVVNTIFFILLTGCTHHFTHFTINDLNYHNPLYGENHNRVSYTLSIHGNYFILIRKHHPNTFWGYQGILVKENRNIYKLENFHHIDSIDYPVSFKNDTIISDGFIVEIDRFIHFRYLIVDGNLYIDTLIKPAVNRPKYNSFRLDEKPKTIQIMGNTYKDGIFKIYDKQDKSKVYLIPDSCNRMILDNIREDMYPTGIDNLKFNKRTKVLSADTNQMQFEIYRGILNRDIRESNKIILLRDKYNL